MRSTTIPVFVLAFALSLLTSLSCKTPTSETEPKIIDPDPIAVEEPKYLLDESALAEYESDIDHAALIAKETKEFYHKGRTIYREACYSCHGNIEHVGSIPNSRAFWKEEFKAGADPYSMYQTLTRGFGLMPPQVRLSPQEKYDVINFIREEFIEENNPEQYVELTDSYLAGLPNGSSLGPKPEPYAPWKEVDYGDFFIHTYDLSNTDDPPRGISYDCCPIPDEDYRDVNFSYKGIAMRLDDGPGGVAKGSAFALFDHDLLRFSGFWTGEGFIDWRDILLNDEHNVFPRTVGEIQVENPITPGWANPETGSFEDPRLIAVDGRPFGPLPREWAHYKGLYHHGDNVIIKYSVGDAEVLERYDILETKEPTIRRVLNVSSSSHDLTLRISPSSFSASVAAEGTEFLVEDGYHVLKIPAGQEVEAVIALSKIAPFSPLLGSSILAPIDLTPFTQGGSTRDSRSIQSPIVRGDDVDAYSVDVFTMPKENPWNSRMRPTGIDFLEGGDIGIVSTIDGEVYKVEGLSQDEGSITWTRIASGLFQPLGVKIQNGDIYISCRDQIVILRDLNGDGETDFYESFNSDHQVTEHFHEFAMGLQTDDDGNFYYAKSGRHARKSLVPQHGTLIKVSPDGQQSEILATGFRAANGVTLNPDGKSFIVTDQEGFWNPKNRINWVEPGGFYGNMWGYGVPKDSSDTAMIQPLMWIDNKYDRSPSELLWAESDRWGPLNGALLNFSYGYGKIFAVLPQMDGKVRQGGMVEVPVPQFPTGIMRGKINPKDGQLYVLGMAAWATNQMIQVGGMYRVRYTGKNLHLPVEMKALHSGMQLRFASDLDRDIAENPDNYEINTWDLKRSAEYGSDRFNTKTLSVKEVSLDKDGKTVLVSMPDIEPTWVMEIIYKLKGSDGKAFEGVVQNTIYELDQSTR